MRTTSIQHWQYHDGVTPINPGNPFGEIVPPRGWTCWAYPEDNNEFESWMAKNCPTADYTFRFNSGNPMWTVNITEEKEAMIFQLRWM
jgi:hypothetical protein